MKKLLLPIFAILFLATSSFGQTISSVTNGNFLNPLTWDCTCIPLPGADVTVAHDVVLNTDVGFASGSLTINSGASLIEDSPRNFAMSGGTFTNNGTTEITTVAFIGGTAQNNGTFTIDGNLLTATPTVNAGTLTGIDSLGNTDQFNNNAGATVTADQFGSTGAVNNYGELNTYNFWSEGPIYNTGVFNVDTSMVTRGFSSINEGQIIVAFDYWSGNDFTNESAGSIHVGRDFVHGDSVATTPDFTNDGYVYVGDDWANVDDLDGSGQWCVEDSTYNTGDITGSFDFCDNTGGSVDLNIGSISSGITFCTGVCNVGLTDNNASSIELEAYPNPFTDYALLSIRESNAEGVQLEAFDQTGRQVEIDYSVNGNLIHLKRGNLNAGIYYFKLTTTEGSATTTIMVVQ